MIATRHWSGFSLDMALHLIGSHGSTRSEPGTFVETMSQQAKETWWCWWTGWRVEGGELSPWLVGFFRQFCGVNMRGHHGGLLGDEPLSWTTAPAFSPVFYVFVGEWLRASNFDGFYFAMILSNKVQANYALNGLELNKNPGDHIIFRGFDSLLGLGYIGYW